MERSFKSTTAWKPKNKFTHTIVYYISVKFHLFTLYDLMNFYSCIILNNKLLLEITILMSFF